MLYQKLKEYIINHPNVSLGELSANFSVSSPQIQSLLNIWIENGDLKKTSPYDLCKKGVCACNSCVISSLETYTWVRFKNE